MAIINVSKDGDDGNDGSTVALSKLTLSAAHTAAVDGDLIRLCTPGGEWREDSGSGSLDFTKASMTSGIDIVGMDPRNPPIISGVSGSASVRITTTGYRFKNVIIDTSSDSNTILVQITAGTAIVAAFQKVKFVSSHDISSATAYLVSVTGAAAHSLTVEDCEFESWSRYMHGVLLGGTGAHRFIRSRINMSRVQSGVYGLRIGTDVTDLVIDKCEFDGYYGIFQSGEVVANCIYKIKDSIINGRNYAFLSNGAAASMRLKILVRNVISNGTTNGFSVTGNNTTVDAHELNSVSGNIAIAVPADGAYSGVQSRLVDCQSTAFSSAGHALLIGAGNESSYIEGHHSAANFGSYAAVLKGTNGVMRNSKLDGGTAQNLLLKGAVDWEISGNHLTQNAGGICIDIRNGDSTPIASGVVFKGNKCECVDGTMFSIGALTTQEDGTSIFDENEYHVSLDGAWGTVRGTSCSSLQDVRDAWTGVTTNEDKSWLRSFSESGDVRSLVGTDLAETTVGNIAGNVSVVFDNADATTTKTADDIGGSSLTVGDIADAVWDELLAGHAVSGSAGETLDNVATGTPPTAAAIRAEIDSNSTQLAAIVADTNELQTDDVPGLIAALNNISAAQVNAEVDTALADYDGPTNTEMVAAFTQIKGATWATTDTLEAIRDRGDAAWTTATGFSTHSAADVNTAVEAGQVGADATAASATAANVDTFLATDGMGQYWFDAVAFTDMPSVATTTADKQALIEQCFTFDATATYNTEAGSLVDQIADNAGGSALTVEGIADAVWDEATSGHATAGSTGAALTAGGSGLTGPNTVTFTVDDGTDPIETARVRLYKGALSESKNTDVSGNASFAVDDGTPWYYSITATGYSSATGTVNVSGDDPAVTVSLSALVLASPTSPSLCTVAFDVINQRGAPVVGAKVLPLIMSEGSIAADAAVIDVTAYTLTDSDGRATMELIRSTEFGPGTGEYRIEVTDTRGRKFYMSYTVPDASSAVATVNVP